MQFEERKSIRKYKPDDVSRELIDQVLEAGRVAPSAKNVQPWHFAVYKNEPKAELLNAMEQGLNKQKKNPFIPKRFKRGLDSAENTLRIMREAPVVIIVMNTDSKGSPYGNVNFGKRALEILYSLSIGACIENMLLEATELGLGSLWVGNTIYAHEEIRKYMGVNCQIAAAVLLGYPDGIPSGRHKKKLEQLVDYYE